MELKVELVCCLDGNWSSPSRLESLQSAVADVRKKELLSSARL